MIISSALPLKARIIPGPRCLRTGISFCFFFFIFFVFFCFLLWNRLSFFFFWFERTPEAAEKEGGRRGIFGWQFLHLRCYRLATNPTSLGHPIALPTLSTAHLSCRVH